MFFVLSISDTLVPPYNLASAGACKKSYEHMVSENAPHFYAGLIVYLQIY